MQGGNTKRRKIEPGAKLVVQRHGGGGGAIRSYNAAEKAAETKVRQQGKKEIRQARYVSPNVGESINYQVEAAVLSDCLRQLEALKTK